MSIQTHRLILFGMLAIGKDPAGSGERLTGVLRTKKNQQLPKVKSKTHSKERPMNDIMCMKILILQGSPRANGNTAWMAEECRKAAEAAGG